MKMSDHVSRLENTLNELARLLLAVFDFKMLMEKVGHALSTLFRRVNAKKIVQKVMEWIRI